MQGGPQFFGADHYHIPVGFTYLYASIGAEMNCIFPVCSNQEKQPSSPVFCLTSVFLCPSQNPRCSVTSPLLFRTFTV
jgi:hypothetical protein